MPAAAIEEMIKVSAMYGLCAVGTVAKFTGAVLRGDKPAATLLHAVVNHMDDIYNAEINEWLR